MNQNINAKKIIGVAEGATGYLRQDGTFVPFPTSMPPGEHTHSYTDLEDIPATFTPSAHRHDASEIDNLVIPAGTWDALEGKPTEFNPSAHTHDDRYYTEIEIDSLLANKVSTEAGKGLSSNDYTTTEKNKLSGIADNANNYVHPTTHSIAEVSGLQEALDTKITLASTLTGWLAATADATLSSTSTLRVAIEILDWRTKNIDGAKIVSGTIADARLSGNVALRTVANTYTAIQSFFGATAATSTVRTSITGDAQYRYSLKADGKQEWGDGTAARDTFLERLSVGWLKLTGGLTMTNGLNTPTVANTSSPSNSHINLAATGVEVKTSQTSNVALRVINTISSTVVDIFRAEKGTTVVAKITHDGTFDGSDFRKNGVKTWVDQTYINPAFMSVTNDIPPTEITKLENAANWTGNNYTGEPIVNTEANDYYNNATYFYFCVADNTWIRR